MSEYNRYNQNGYVIIVVYEISGRIVEINKRGSI